jgi:hypothetical protein
LFNFSCFHRLLNDLALSLTLNFIFIFDKQVENDVRITCFHCASEYYKITATIKGAGQKVKVSGPGLIGGYVGQDLRVMVDTQEAGNGSII